MNLEDLAAVVKKLEDHEARYKMLETAIMEQGAAMAEILELLTKQGPDTARAIAAALKNLTVNMPEPKAAQINVTVPEIRMPEIKIPAAPAGAASADWTKLSVAIKQPNGPDRVMTITKSK